MTTLRVVLNGCVDYFTARRKSWDKGLYITFDFFKPGHEMEGAPVLIDSINATYQLWLPTIEDLTARDWERYL